MSVLHILPNENSAKRIGDLFPEFKIVSVADYNLFVGPLSNFPNRLSFLAEMIFDDSSRWKEMEWIFDDVNAFVERIRIEKPKSVVVWHDEFTNDQIFLRMICWLLRGYDGLVEIVNVKNWYEWDVHSDPARTRIEYKKSNAIFVLDAQERDRYSDEYIKIQNRKEMLREFKDGKFIFITADHYDSDILAQIRKEWQTAIRVVGRCLIQQIDRGKTDLNDFFFLWRIRNLIRSGSVEAEGNLYDSREFRIRLPQGK